MNERSFFMNKSMFWGDNVIFHYASVVFMNQLYWITCGKKDCQMFCISKKSSTFASRILSNLY